MRFHGSAGRIGLILANCRDRRVVLGHGFVKITHLAVRALRPRFWAAGVVADSEMTMLCCARR